MIFSKCDKKDAMEQTKFLCLISISPFQLFLTFSNVYKGWTEGEL